MSTMQWQMVRLNDCDFLVIHPPLSEETKEHDWIGTSMYNVQCMQLARKRNQVVRDHGHIQTS